MKIAIGILLVIYSGLLQGQNGTLDSSFADFGKKIIVFDSLNSDALGSVKMAQDENYLVFARLDRLGGPTDLSTRLLKLDRNGEIIPGFGAGGFIKPEVDGKPFFPQNYIELPNGSFRFYSPEYLVQYHKNGQPDLNYGTNGVIKIKTPADFGYFVNGIKIIQTEAKSYVCLAGVFIGIPRYILYKIDPAGNLVTQFPDSAFHLIPEKINGVSLSRGNILADQHNQIYFYGEGYHATKGYCLFILKLKENGAIDKSYGDLGLFTIYGIRYDSQSTFAQADPDGIVFLFGSSTVPTAGHYLIKINAGGQLDKDFNMTGSLIQDKTPGFRPVTLLLFTDYGFVLGGESRLAPGSDPKHTLVFYHKSGRIDSSFATNGILTTQFNPSFGIRQSRCDVLIRDREMSFVSSGRIIAGGYNAIGITRHHVNSRIPSKLIETLEWNYKILDWGDHFILQMDGDGPHEISLMDLWGRPLIAKKFNGTQFEFKKPAPGNYILTLTKVNSTRTKQLIVH